MSALPDSLPDEPRPLRFARPIRLPAAIPPEPRVYRYGDPDIPCPPGLRRYLREPSAYSRLLMALYSHWGTLRSHGHVNTAALAKLSRALVANCASETVTALVLELCPVARCGWCDDEYLRYSVRLLYCSDLCRRDASHDAELARTAAPQ